MPFNNLQKSKERLPQQKSQNKKHKFQVTEEALTFQLNHHT